MTTIIPTTLLTHLGLARFIGEASTALRGSLHCPERVILKNPRTGGTREYRLYDTVLSEDGSEVVSWEYVSDAGGKLSLFND